MKEGDRVRQYNSTLSRTYGWRQTENTKISRANHHYRVEKRKPKYVKTGRPRGVHVPKVKTRDQVWRLWQIRCAVMFNDQKGYPTQLACLRCGKTAVRLCADHVMPRSNRLHGDPWAPTNGQYGLCWDCNGLKGSQHGPQWDFRPKEYKEFQKNLAQKEWIYNPVHRTWERQNG